MTIKSLIEQATALPWQKIKRTESAAPIRIGKTKNSGDIAVVYDLPPHTGSQQANARLICLAVNNLPALVETLTDIADRFEMLMKLTGSCENTAMYNVKDARAILAKLDQEAAK